MYMCLTQGNATLFFSMRIRQCLFVTKQNASLLSLPPSLPSLTPFANEHLNVFPLVFARGRANKYCHFFLFKIDKRKIKEVVVSVGWPLISQRGMVNVLHKSHSLLVSVDQRQRILLRVDS